jgi:hypothetical protein
MLIESNQGAGEGVGAINNPVTFTTSGQKIATTAASIGTPIALAAIMGASAAAGPVGLAIGAAIVGVTALISSIFGKGNQRASAATERINYAEDLAKKNLEAYMASPHTQVNQAAALQNFDDIWAWIVSQDGCGDQDLKSAGEACISERSPGGKYDYRAWYRDPIANAPLTDEPGASSTTAESVLSSVTGGGMGWLLLAGLAVVGVVMLSGSGEESKRGGKR